jgi:hypothetical protein
MSKKLNFQTRLTDSRKTLLSYFDTELGKIAQMTDPIEKGNAALDIQRAIILKKHQIKKTAVQRAERITDRHFWRDVAFSAAFIVAAIFVFPPAAVLGAVYMMARHSGDNQPRMIDYPMKNRDNDTLNKIKHQDSLFIDQLDVRNETAFAAYKQVNAECIERDALSSDAESYTRISHLFNNAAKKDVIAGKVLEVPFKQRTSRVRR